jgi:hypothetical protein
LTLLRLHLADKSNGHRGQLEFGIAPEREPRRVYLIFPAGVDTHRHEFLASTQLGAGLEMAREQGANTIEVESTLNKI